MAKKTRKKLSRRKTTKRRRMRKQKGGEMSTPFGDSGNVPKGLGGTVTTMSEEGVPVTKSLEQEESVEEPIQEPVAEEPVPV